jgi:hypothetical protein
LVIVCTGVKIIHIVYASCIYNIINSISPSRTIQTSRCPAVAFHPVDISVSLKVFAYNPVGVAGPAGAAAVLIVADCPGKSYHQYLANILK